jgi:gamma-glutamylcyclotransferase (GGCT)/AIG2-like uncharacterized protein YtfP
VARERLDLIVARLDELTADPRGGSVAAWQDTWRLVGADRPNGGEREDRVAPATAPACAEAVDEALGRPSRRLVAYGTLRPGAPNHHLVAGLGTWEAATVRGRLGDWHGYPILRPAVDGPELPVMMLTAAGLPGRMAQLDTFEGPAYRRSWVVAEVGERGRGRPVVAQCYVDAVPGVQRRASP